MGRTPTQSRPPPSAHRRHRPPGKAPMGTFPTDQCASRSRHPGLPHRRARLERHRLQRRRLPPGYVCRPRPWRIAPPPTAPTRQRQRRRRLLPPGEGDLHPRAAQAAMADAMHWLAPAASATPTATGNHRLPRRHHHRLGPLTRRPHPGADREDITIMDDATRPTSTPSSRRRRRTRRHQRTTSPGSAPPRSATTPPTAAATRPTTDTAA